MSRGVGGSIEVRAFRGTRQASVYRDVVVPERPFVRILVVAEQAGLSLLASLDPPGPHELDKDRARALAEEVTELRSSGELPDLDQDLVSLAEIARWCAHAREDAWLRIVRAA